MNFANPQAFWLFFALPLIVLAYWYHVRRMKDAIEKIGHPDMVQRMLRSYNRVWILARYIIIVFGIGFLILALARPQYGVQLGEVKARGLDVMIGLDLSKSMYAEDIKPNRLMKAKHEIAQLVELLEGNRVGLIAFSGVSFVQCPLTLDRGAFNMFLDTLEPGMLPVGGTDITGAIEKAIESLSQTEMKFRTFILFSDGEDTLGKPIAAANKAAEAGIAIYCVGVGTPAGNPIPVFDKEGAQFGYVKDASGGTVISKLGESGLQRIAAVTEARYYRATVSEREVENLYQNIRNREKKEFEAREMIQYSERFQYPLLVGLVLLLVATAIPERKRSNGQPVGEPSY